MKGFPSLLAVGFLIAAPPVQAQVTLDVAKITCGQLLTNKIVPSKYLALWLSGYYNGQRNNTVLDPRSMEKNVEAVQGHCHRKQSTPVMEVVKTVLGAGK